VRLRRAGLRLAPPSAEAPDSGRSAAAPAFPAWPAWSATSASDLRLGESILKGRAALSADSVDNGVIVDAASRREPAGPACGSAGGARAVGTALRLAASHTQSRAFQ